MGTFFFPGVEKVPSVQVANRLNHNEKTFTQVYSHSLELNIPNQYKLKAKKSCEVQDVEFRI